MDEVHLIASDRGPVYEILISKFQMLYGDVQVLALSATIGNAEELAEWLSAKLIASTWRPVELKEEVVVGKDKYVKIKELVSRSVAGGGQVLVFVNSRKSAEAVAERLGSDLKLAEDEERIRKLEDEVLSALPSPTSQCRRLSSCIGGGTAFHHAGITNKQRVLIEDAFKSGLLKAIVATPTLAAGVNLPSRMVIVRDVQRYDEDGAGYIPVLEYKQQVGRAGRPKYDTYGEAALIAKTESEKEYFTEKYVCGEPEPIYSQLGVEPVLRFHILAAVASGFSRTDKALMEFFRSTFFGHQYGLEGFEFRIKNIIKKLTEWDLLKTENNYLLPTSLGRRVSELYIDPQTAYNYIQILSKAEAENKFPAVGLLEALCDAAEMPLLRIRRQEEAKLWEDACRSADELFRDLSGFDLDAMFLERFRTAKLFMQWINEETEEYILETYNVAPGTLHQRLQIAKWLAYSASELSDLVGLKKSAKEMKHLEVRIESGVKEELLVLVAIKGIGRVRARKLFGAGIRTVADLKKTETKKLAALLGEKTAENIKEEIEKESKTLLLRCVRVYRLQFVVDVEEQQYELEVHPQEEVVYYQQYCADYEEDYRHYDRQHKAVVVSSSQAA
jgi:helicase